MVSTRSTPAATRKAQRIRLQRMAWGFSNQACTLLIIAALYLLELVPGARALEYVLAVTVLYAAFIALIKSDLNLRLRDPSMAAAQILTPQWPALYLMFFVEAPQARVAFLLMAIVALVFGTLALERRGMLMLAALTLFSYGCLLAALYVWAPQRLNAPVDAIVFFAYAAMLLSVALLTSFTAGLRRRLKQQNEKLARNMVKLEELATRDPLTHLPNRRAVMDQLAREKSRAERRTPLQDALCISILDVDYFKRINDTWGHEAGDRVLCQISEALQDTMRKGDFIGRFGGEEFVVILPETTAEAAHVASERIRQCVEQLAFADLPDMPPVTVSQGVAVHRRGDSVEQTLKRADEALYEAKNGGRNKVVVSED